MKSSNEQSRTAYKRDDCNLFISNGAVPLHISLKINFKRMAFNC